MATASAVGLQELRCESMTLGNGLRVRLIPLPHLQSATVSCFVRAGSRYESQNTNGLSHFLEHMLYRGTARHPKAHELNLAIERLGGTLDAATHVDFTSYDLTLPRETITEGTELLADVLQNPLLTELGTEKQIIREEILEELNEQGEQIDIDNVSRQLLYGEHSLGFTIAGPISNLDAFGVNDLHRHHRAHYAAKNTVLCVAGAFDEEAIKAVIARGFESFQTGTASHGGKWKPSTGQPRFSYVHESGSQTEVRLSFHTPGVGSADAPTFILLDRILDDGLSTRVHQTVCEERGLAYEAFSGQDTFEDCGVYDFGASVEHGKVPTLVDTLLELVAALTKATPTPEEIDKAKRRYLWDLRTVVDDPEDTSHFIGTSALFSLPESLQTIADQVMAVTAEDVRRVVRDYLTPSKAHLTCVGVLEDRVLRSLEGAICQ
ncbi:MAG: pitrilysin family protein [Myxococcota bacterium]